MDTPCAGCTSPSSATGASHPCHPDIYIATSSSVYTCIQCHTPTGCYRPQQSFEAKVGRHIHFSRSHTPCFASCSQTYTVSQHSAFFCCQVFFPFITCSQTTLKMVGWQQVMKGKKISQEKKALYNLCMTPSGVMFSYFPFSQYHQQTGCWHLP